MSGVVITEINSEVVYGSQPLVQTIGFVALRNFMFATFTSQIQRACLLNAGAVGNDILNSQNYIWLAAGGAALSIMTATVRIRKMYKQAFTPPQSTVPIEAAFRTIVPAATINLDEVEDTVAKFFEYIVKPITVYVRDRAIYGYTFIYDPNYVIGEQQMATNARLTNEISLNQAGVIVGGVTAPTLNAAYSRFVAFKTQMLGAGKSALSTPAVPCGCRLFRYIQNGINFDVYTGIDKPTDLSKEELIACFLFRDWFQNPIYNAVYVVVVPPVVNPDVFATAYTPNQATDLIAKMTPPEWEVNCFNFIGRIALRYWPDLTEIKDKMRVIADAVVATQNALPFLDVGMRDPEGPARGEGEPPVRRRRILGPGEETGAAPSAAEGSLPESARAPQTAPAAKAPPATH